MSKHLLCLALCFFSLKTQAQQSDFSNINFTKADAIANKYKGATLESLPILSYNLTSTLKTDVEKFRAIYRWVCANIENDYYAYLKNKKTRNKLKKDSLKLATWNAYFTQKTFKRLLKEQKTVCTGYAYLIKELANLAEIKCEILDGYGRTADVNIEELSIPNHSWNAVQLNNKWYLCDATWSSGIYDLNHYSFKYDYNDGYFLTDPNLFVKNHYPVNTKWLLTDTIIPITSFLNGPIVYPTTFKQAIVPTQPVTLHLEVKQNQEVIFLLKEGNPMDTSNITIEMTSGTYKTSVKPTINKNSDELLEVKHTFDKRGFYDFHIKLKEEYLITYTVKVEKK
ncbi:hypothetical protein FIA58_007135 [Flavobacterium jejuense]|uniref:Transglutaminase-like domain-containing protein n=1 Tax=Flavobacterium jejuense TaxID=1544455 RepID=A0ABX0IPF5_9FLAO|nr:transglutaminase domain-containing protein [Flavobacterium jejuense]NHN25446.1 hypothetical protein [Flavobacterium jejuense]